MEKTTKSTLIIVDIQNDFCHPEGSLFVNKGDIISYRILNIIPKFDEIIFTLDWHPNSHCSFKPKGPWPIHCVNYTWGSSVPHFLVYQAKDKALFYRKGMNPLSEEYGAFNPPIEYFTNDYYLNELDIYERIKHCNRNYVICGIAGDYCVLETIKNLLKLVPKERVSVFLEGITSIDEGIKINEFIKNENLKIYKDDN